VLGLIHLVIYLFRSAWNWLSTYGSSEWPLAEAVVTDNPLRVQGFGRSTVEIPYSYRVQGELYTGLYEEPGFGGSGSEYMERFPKGKSFVVRVKPGEPEVSVVRDDDQADGTRKRLERIDESLNRS
jgi:hypothetical protein